MLLEKDEVVGNPDQRSAVAGKRDNRAGAKDRVDSAALVAERAGISRNTLHAIEQGSPTVSMGGYLQVLFVLGLEQTILELAADDVLGRKLQDAGLPVRARAPKQPPQQHLSTQ